MSLRPHSVLCALVALWAFTSAAAQPTSSPYVFSERVGPEIDAAERDYFGLFPGAGAGASAQAFDEGERVRVVIERAGADSTLTVTRGAAEALGRFIETFEQAEAAFYNPNWQLVSSFVRADVPVPYAGSARAATFFVDGGRYRGHATYASDEVLLIDQSATPFDWRTYSGRSDLALRASEVERVQFAPGWIARPYIVLAGVPLGIAVNEWLMGFDARGPDNVLERRIFAAALGAAAVKVFSIVYARTRSYERALPALEEAAWFTRDAPVLELPAESVLLRQTEADRPAPTPVWRGSFGWLSVGTGSAPLGENSQTYEFFSGFDPDADPEREVRYENAGARLEAAAAVRPLAWLDIGAGVYITSAERPDPVGSRAVPYAELEEVAYSQPFVRVFADVDVLRLALGQSRFGLEVGGGLLRSESAVAFDVSNVIGRADRRFTYEPAGYDLTEAGFTPFYQATLSVGLARETSAYASIIAHSAPDVDVPLFEAGLDFDPEVTVFRVEPHTVSFDYVGVSAGVRLGF